MQGSPLYEYSRKTVGKSQDGGEPKLENLKLANLFWCGDWNQTEAELEEGVGCFKCYYNSNYMIIKDFLLRARCYSVCVATVSIV